MENGKICSNNNETGFISEKMKVGDVIECVVDRDKGTVGFSVNGAAFAIAFTDYDLTSGDLWFAVSLGKKYQSMEIVY